MQQEVSVLSIPSVSPHLLSSGGNGSDIVIYDRACHSASDLINAIFCQDLSTLHLLISA